MKKEKKKKNKLHIIHAYKYIPLDIIIYITKLCNYIIWLHIYCIIIYYLFSMLEGDAFYKETYSRQGDEGCKRPRV